MARYFCGWAGTSHTEEDLSTPLGASVTSQNMQTPMVWTRASSGTEMLQGPWIGCYPHADIQQVKNTFFLVSCAPPVITELAGKAKRLHMWPFHCALVADADREIQGKRTHLTLLLWPSWTQILLLIRYSLQHSGFTWTSQYLGESSKSKRNTIIVI